MRLFNFEISHEEYENLSQTDESVSLSFPTHESHATNPIIVGSFSLIDDIVQDSGSTDEPHGSYAFTQNIGSLSKSQTDSASFGGELSAVPTNQDETSSDTIEADVIVLSNARFRG